MILTHGYLFVEKTIVLMRKNLVGVETNGLDAAILDAKSQHEFTYETFGDNTYRSIRPNMGFNIIT